MSDDDVPERSLFGFRGALLGPTRTMTVAEIEEEFADLPIRDLGVPTAPDDPNAMQNEPVIAAICQDYERRISAGGSRYDDKLEAAKWLGCMLAASQRIEALDRQAPGSERRFRRDVVALVQAAYRLGAIVGSDEERAKAVREARAAAGQKSGAVRRRKAVKVAWHEKALPIALEIRTARPTMSDAEVAERLRQRLIEVGSGPILLSAVIRWLRSKRNAGELPGRNRGG